MCLFCFLMLRRPPRSTRTDTLFPYTTLFRSFYEIFAIAGAVGLATTFPAAPPIVTSFSDAIAQATGWPLEAVLLERPAGGLRSEEHTSELQSLMRTSYAVFCLKKKNITTH